MFDGSVEDMQKIMPGVIDNTPIKITDDKVGSVYLQEYKEGKRVMEYEVETLEYLNLANEKKMKVSFTIANMFEITARFELIKLEDNKTNFKYTTTNSPLKWFYKLFLLFASDKVVISFVERVKNVAHRKGNRMRWTLFLRERNQPLQQYSQVHLKKLMSRQFSVG